MLATIVDRNDRVIGSKRLDEIKDTDIYRVAGLWVTNTTGQILLAQRQLGKRNDPGKWGPAVAGTVEPNETYESNIYKEAEEEIGLSGYKFTLGPKVINNASRTFFVQWFTCIVDWPLEKFKIQKEEVEKLEWIDRQTLIDLLTNDSSRFIAGSEKVWQTFLA